MLSHSLQLQWCFKIQTFCFVCLSESQMYQKWLCCFVSVVKFRIGWGLTVPIYRTLQDTSETKIIAVKTTFFYFYIFWYKYFFCRFCVCVFLIVLLPLSLKVFLFWYEASLCVSLIWSFVTFFSTEKRKSEWLGNIKFKVDKWKRMRHISNCIHRADFVDSRSSSSKPNFFDQKCLHTHNTNPGWHITQFRVFTHSSIFQFFLVYHHHWILMAINQSASDTCPSSHPFAILLNQFSNLILSLNFSFLFHLFMDNYVSIMGPESFALNRLRWGTIMDHDCVDDELQF